MPTKNGKLVSLLFFVAVWVIGQGLTPLRAQTSFGTIVGTVTDPTGAGVPGATVIVTNADTGLSRTLETNDVGDYRVPSLLPAIYEIAVEHSGFKRNVVRDVELPVARTIKVDMVLELGAVTESVEVTAGGVLLDTADATLGTVVENREVVELPLNGRYYSELMLLVPGSVPQGTIFLVGGGRNFSISGARHEQNSFTLDGVYNNETFFKGIGLQPSIDAIQEFKIQTNITSAEYGEAAGANVNVVVKSGTNEFHGSVFEFLRNDALDANDFFRNRADIEKPAFRQNQYGLVAGGPVIKNRTFWLFNYEGSRRRRASTVPGTIPTTTQLGGDFSGQLGTTVPGITDALGRPVLTGQIYDPFSSRNVTAGQVDSVTGLTAVQTGLVRDPFLGNIIPPSMIDPIASQYASTFYPPTTVGGTGNFINTSPERVNQDQFTIRMDHQIRQNLNFFARYSHASNDQVTAREIPTVNNTLANEFRNTVASWTYLIDPTTVFDFKLGYHRNNLQVADTTPGDPAQFLSSTGLQGVGLKQIPLFPQVTISGFSDVPQAGFPFPANDYQVIGNLTKIKGKHSLKTGFNFHHARNLDDGFFSGIFDFGKDPTTDPLNPGATGEALAAFLLGLPNRALRNLGDTAAIMRWTLYQFYLQDDIKVTPKLTLNLGLRYEWNQWPRHLQDKLSMFDRTCRCFVWAGTNPLTGEPPNVRRTVMDPDFNNFAPRFGFAYLATPKTTVRGGYSVFYASNFLWEVQGIRGNWPYALSETLSGLNLQFPTSPWRTTFTPNTDVTPGSPPSSQHTLGRTDRTSYTQQWNIGVQRELAKNLLLDVNYVGTKGTKMPIFINGNQALPGPGTVGCPQLGPATCSGQPDHPRPFPEANFAFSEITNQANSIYHGLQAKAEKRFSQGLSFLASYTWSKYIDLGGSGFSQSATLQDPNNGQADRALGTFDRRHIFTLSYLYELPFGPRKPFARGSSGVLAKLIEGWQVNGITNFHSGNPINILIDFDNANVAGRSFAQRPDRVLGVPMTLAPGPDKTINRLNPAAFAVPAPFTFGNLGRNVVRGPGFSNFDISLFKNIFINEGKQTVQFRVEFFNAFNNVNLLPPGGGSGTITPGPVVSTFGTATFGQIFGVQNASREIQFALKILF